MTIQRRESIITVLWVLVWCPLYFVTYGLHRRTRSTTTVGLGHLSEIKFLKRTLRWHEDESNFCLSGGTGNVEELAQFLGHTGDRAVTQTKTPGTNATGSGARDALEPLDTFQAAVYRTAAGMIGHIVQTRLPVCSENSDELDARAEEARLDELSAVGYVPRDAW